MVDGPPIEAQNRPAGQGGQAVAVPITVVVVLRPHGNGAVIPEDGQALSTGHVVHVVQPPPAQNEPAAQSPLHVAVDSIIAAPYVPAGHAVRTPPTQYAACGHFT